MHKQSLASQIHRPRRPLIQIVKGMVAVTFLGGCRLDGPDYNNFPTSDGGDASADASRDDAAHDAGHDAGKDAKGDDAAIEDAGNDADRADAADAGDAG